MSNRIDTIEALEALYETPLPTTLTKEVARVTPEYRRLIEAAPFAGVATIGPGGMDCSPRGDGPGFVRILDETTLALPDRRGNNRLDTLRNIVEDGRIALLFLIPGWNECLRVNGRAYLSTEPDLLESFAVDGKAPVTVAVITIETMYFQCARAIKRAQLWDPSRHVDKADLPTAGALIRSAVDGFDADGYDAVLQDRQARTMY